MKSAYLCLGGNLGNRQRLLDESKGLIEKHCGKITACSRIYETAPWKSKSQNAFLNQVIKVSVKMKAEELMKRLLKIERKLGRSRGIDKNEDRTCDIDILFFGDEVINTRSLTIPHPRIEKRKFVLKPLMDLDPEMKHPGSKKKIGELYKTCKDGLSVNEYKAPFYICIEGNIGAGKSTLAKALAEKLNALYIPEQFEKNSLLPLFYQDAEKYGFLLEYSFLLSRFQQISDACAGKPKFIVSDYSIYKCKWFASLNLKKKDRIIFDKHFNGIEDQLNKPDLLIYLDTPFENLIRNIRKRGRKYENGISIDYLRKVEKTYRKGLNELGTIPRLNIKIGKYEKNLTSSLLSQIKKELKIRGINNNI